MSLRVAAGFPGGGIPGSNVFTDAAAVSGTTYTLTHAPTGPLLNVYLDGVLQLAANYSVTGTTLTFSGLTMGNYAQFSVTYTY